jgi:hypothetical protein
MSVLENEGAKQRWGSAVALVFSKHPGSSRFERTARVWVFRYVCSERWEREAIAGIIWRCEWPASLTICPETDEVKSIDR